jgi:hypothetical protein
MKKIRYYLAVGALGMATLIGPVFVQTMGAGLTASAAANHHASSVSASFSGKSTRSGAIARALCGMGGVLDC